MHSNLSMQTDV